jgi:hypothetical protein
VSFIQNRCVIFLGQLPQTRHLVTSLFVRDDDSGMVARASPPVISHRFRCSHRSRRSIRNGTWSLMQCVDTDTGSAGRSGRWCSKPHALQHRGWRRCCCCSFSHFVSGRLSGEPGLVLLHCGLLGARIVTGHVRRHTPSSYSTQTSSNGAGCRRGQLRRRSQHNRPTLQGWGGITLSFQEPRLGLRDFLHSEEVLRCAVYPSIVRGAASSPWVKIKGGIRRQGARPSRRTAVKQHMVSSLAGVQGAVGARAGPLRRARRAAPTRSAWSSNTAA